MFETTTQKKKKVQGWPLMSHCLLAIFVHPQTCAPEMFWRAQVLVALHQSNLCGISDSFYGFICARRKSFEMVYTL